MDNIEYVIKNSESVKINIKNIDKLISTIEKNDYIHWSKKDEFFKQLSEKKLILFSFILESMNFCFWPNYEWKTLYKPEK